MEKLKPIPLINFTSYIHGAAVFITGYEIAASFYGLRQYVCGNFLNGFHTINVPINKNMSLPSRCYYCQIEIDWLGTEEKLVKECPECDRRYDDLNLNLCPNPIHNPKSIALIQKNIRK
jgi:hypothetical protein